MGCFLWLSIPAKEHGFVCWHAASLCWAFTVNLILSSHLSGHSLAGYVKPESHQRFTWSIMTSNPIHNSYNHAQSAPLLTCRHNTFRVDFYESSIAWKGINLKCPMVIGMMDRCIPSQKATSFPRRITITSPQFTPTFWMEDSIISAWKPSAPGIPNESTASCKSLFCSICFCRSSFWAASDLKSWAGFGIIV